jgi:hypothetical protein
MIYTPKTNGGKPGAGMSWSETCEARCECQNKEWSHHYHWRNTAKYQTKYCHRCNDVKAFHWKSFWRRLKCLFINETLR